MTSKVKEETKKKINEIIEQGLQPSNIEMLYTLVDIHKDMANEEYWKDKEEVMRYRAYSEGDYPSGYSARGRSRDSRGRYKDGRSRYSDGRGYSRGEEMIDNIYRDHMEYSEGKEQYRRGNYGAKEDVMKSLEYMMESVVCFVEMLMQDAESQEEVQVIKEYTRKIAEM